MNTSARSRVGFRRAVLLPVTRIVSEPLGGWYVIRGAHGWLLGSRAEALAAKAALDAQRGRA